jgi:uncharacterized protein (DUF1697 family)
MSPAIFMVRGINVGGSRPLKMETLKKLCEGLGFAHVRTYLQSGNVVCEAKDSDVRGWAAALERCIARECGFEADVVARSAGALASAIAANPFAGRPAYDPAFLHATFPVASFAGMPLREADLPRAPGERAALSGETIYLYCPWGYGNTKLNNSFFERKMGVRATTRKWKTVLALEAMARGLSA